MSDGQSAPLWRNRIQGRRLTRVSSDGGDLGGTEEEGDGGEEGCDGELHCWRVVDVQVNR